MGRYSRHPRGRRALSPPARAMGGTAAGRTGMDRHGIWTGTVHRSIYPAHANRGPVPSSGRKAAVAVVSPKRSADLFAKATTCSRTANHEATTRPARRFPPVDPRTGARETARQGPGRWTSTSMVHVTSSPMQAQRCRSPTGWRPWNSPGRSLRRRRRS